MALPLITETESDITEMDEERDLQPGEVEHPYSDWLTIQGVGVAIGLSIQRVSHHIGNGRIRFIRTPLGRLFDPESVAKFKHEREVEIAARSKAYGKRT